MCCRKHDFLFWLHYFAFQAWHSQEFRQVCDVLRLHRSNDSGQMHLCIRTSCNMQSSQPSRRIQINNNIYAEQMNHCIICVLFCLCYGSVQFELNLSNDDNHPAVDNIATQLHAKVEMHALAISFYVGDFQYSAVCSLHFQHFHVDFHKWFEHKQSILNTFPLKCKRVVDVKMLIHMVAYPVWKMHSFLPSWIHSNCIDCELLALIFASKILFLLKFSAFFPHNKFFLVQNDFFLFFSLAVTTYFRTNCTWKCL